MLQLLVALVCAGSLIGAAEQTTKGSSQPGPDGTPVTGKDGAPMVLIPEGPFLMGSNEGLPNERPEHKTSLDAYYIDQFEITIKLFSKFLEETKHPAPPLWEEDAEGSTANRPAVGVSWFDAQAYCKWAGERLPTEAEWEKAARGTDGRRYPWGHMQPFVDIANYNRGQWVSYAITLIPVDTLGGMSVRHGTKEGGKSPYGLYHMAGNAAEWVADWYDREYYAKSPEKNPKGPAEGDRRVIRGGSWNDPPSGLRASARIAAEPDFQDLTVGFRCAMDGPK
jgi:formylglycine-generating enzyme required for sulfatase activity